MSLNYYIYEKTVMSLQQPSSEITLKDKFQILNRFSQYLIGFIKKANSGKETLHLFDYWLMMEYFSKNLEEKLILKEPFVLVVPQEHPFAKCDHIQIKDLQNETFITFSRDCGPTIYDSFLALCAKAGFVPDILHQATQFNSVLRLVESGFGISLLPVSVTLGYSLKLKFVPIVNCDENIPLIMLYRKDNPNPSLNHLINHFNN